jgi:hypothetical protein
MAEQAARPDQRRELSHATSSERKLALAEGKKFLQG